jgi:hypothetical protein
MVVSDYTGDDHNYYHDDNDNNNDNDDDDMTYALEITLIFIYFITEQTKVIKQ